jgi:tRNA(adenine34) deaminase
VPRAAPHRYDAAMRQAIEEARLAQGSDDVPVGAMVLGPTGALLGRGHNAREALGDPTAHAEVMALRDAAGSLGHWRLESCTLVVTLEPCTMCAGAVVLARLSTLVFGAYDPKAGAVGSLWDVVRDRRVNSRPDVIGGVLEDETSDLLRQFFATHRREAT